MSDARKVARPSGASTRDQRDAEHVGGQREDGGAMEVESHGEDHDGFGDEADEGEFGGVEGDADEGCGEVRGDAG